MDATTKNRHSSGGCLQDPSLTLLLVNFGGPRSLDEVFPFLRTLLCDQDVLQTSWPSFFHRFFFSFIAKRRAKKSIHDYRSIGCSSPIYADTERLASSLKAKTFHRYLPQTHQETLFSLRLQDTIIVFPLFPHFSYTTTGSCARFLKFHLPHAKMHWVRAYGTHPAFIALHVEAINVFLQKQQINSENLFLLFSAHGLPVKYKDSYAEEVRASFEAIASHFPRAKSTLCYQSRFDKTEWLKPYTDEFCRSADFANRQILVVPISFTSDHIETLYEIEQLYLPLLRARDLTPFRLPAVQLTPHAVNAILNTATFHETDTLIRK